MLDTRRPVETPEGVEIGLRVAGPVPRFLAFFVDAAIRYMALLVISIPLGMLGKSGTGGILILLFLSEWFYPVYFELFWKGATPGKRAAGLVVLHQDGTPVGATASMLRNLLRFADFLPIGYAFGIVSMLVSRDFRRLGDLAAGTVVVHRDDVRSGSRIPFAVRNASPAAARPLAPAVALDLPEQRAVVDFAERLPGWTEERAMELASLATPLTGATGRAGVERLVSMAGWLVGRR